MRHRLLIIEGDVRSVEPGVATALADLAFDPAYDCGRASWTDRVLYELDRLSYDLVVAVAGARTPAQTAAFEFLKTHPPAAPFFVVVSVQADDELLRQVSEAANDFVLAPIRPAELRLRLRRVLSEPRPDLERVSRRLLEEFGGTKLVGRDPAFVKAVEKVPRFARAHAPVLITGETGTGKEVCARALHHLSRRRSLPFIAVDCGAIPDQLFENEFFGHAKGAFTDAHRDRKGLVAIADGGTLLLDEIDALSLTAQAKLLRFLQERTYRPLGSDRFAQADVRVFAATNRDLAAAVDSRQFRADLYFRLNVLHIELPPLRERRGDVELLACAALEECGDAADGTARSFSAAALRMLALHDWPGNVRELYNVVQRAVVACDGDEILPCHLDLLVHAPEADAAGCDFRSQRAAAVATFERRYVEALLRKHLGNVTHAAREAGQDRRAFGRFIKKYNIDRRKLIA
jgi:two-component system, NtrC family, response regulator GlrR